MMNTPMTPPLSDASSLSDPAFMTELRTQMLKFASLQLSDRDLAEDAVQEALTGALKNAAAFQRGAALKTWVFGILKHKIADILRQRHRLVEASRLLQDDDDEDELNHLFDTRGHWQMDERPATWSAPAQAVKDQQFWRVFEVCLNGMPENLSRLFMMREFIELESHEICAALDISTSNFHVMLYRARLRLRECLENHWFVPGETP